MTTTAFRTVKDLETVSYGLVDSANVNSFAADSTNPSKLNKSELKSQKEEEDFVNTFICHLIFYTIFCFSLFLHILIDLGFGIFVKKKFQQLIGVGKKNIFDKKTAFA